MAGVAKQQTASDESAHIDGQLFERGSEERECMIIDLDLEFDTEQLESMSLVAPSAPVAAVPPSLETQNIGLGRHRLAVALAVLILGAACFYFVAFQGHTMRRSIGVQAGESPMLKASKNESMLDGARFMQDIGVDWTPVSATIDAFTAIKPDISVQVGDHRGLLYRFIGKNLVDYNWVWIASEIKFVSVAMIMHMTEIGIIGLDDRANKWLSFWPTDPSDMRSEITLRHCLSLTTGFFSLELPDDSNLTMKPSKRYPYGARDELTCNGFDVVECAKYLLRNQPHVWKPGTAWTYSTDHWRIAAAMVVMATGEQNLEVLLRRHVFQRAEPPMFQTYFYPRPSQPKGTTPNLGSQAYSTPQDYQRFLDSYFRGVLLSRSSMEEIEANQLHNVSVRVFSGKNVSNAKWSYGMGLWKRGPHKGGLNTTFCGSLSPCLYDSGQYGSVCAIMRRDVSQECDWKFSEKCEFYIHINTGYYFRHSDKSAIKTLMRMLDFQMRKVLSNSLADTGSGPMVQS